MPAADPNSSGPGAEGSRSGGDTSTRWASVRSSISSSFRWHLLAFVSLNGVLTAANIVLGGGWWAFWPFLVSAVALGVHYMLNKTLFASEGWVEDRVEELNIKSYDRAHIEELKARLGPAAVERREAAAGDPERDPDRRGN